MRLPIVSDYHVISVYSVYDYYLQKCRTPAAFFYLYKLGERASYMFDFGRMLLAISHDRFSITGLYLP